MIKVSPDGNTYPYSIHNLRQDNPTISFPREMSDGLLADYGVYPVIEQTLPSPDPTFTVRYMRNTEPHLVGDQWELGYTEVPVDPEVTASRLLTKQAETDRATLGIDPEMATFLSMSTDDLTAYLTEALATPEGTAKAITQIGLVTHLLARREFL